MVSSIHAGAVGYSTPRSRHLNFSASTLVWSGRAIGPHDVEIPSARPCRLRQSGDLLLDPRTSAGL